MCIHTKTRCEWTLLTIYGPGRRDGKSRFRQLPNRHKHLSTLNDHNFWPFAPFSLLKIQWKSLNRARFIATTCKGCSDYRKITITPPRFVMSSYYVRHALQTIQVSPPTRGDLKNTQEHRFLMFFEILPSRLPNLATGARWPRWEIAGDINKIDVRSNGTNLSS